MDQAAQAMLEAGADLLREALAASDPKATLQAAGERVDEAFLMVIAANITAAQRTGQTELTERLETLNQLAIDAIQERLPPQERLVNELMMTATAEESSQLLRQNMAQIDTAFVKKLNELADDQTKRGDPEAAKRLRQLAREASTMLF